MHVSNIMFFCYLFLTLAPSILHISTYLIMLPHSHICKQNIICYTKYNCLNVKNQQIYYIYPYLSIIILHIFKGRMSFFLHVSSSNTNQTLQLCNLYSEDS